MKKSELTKLIKEAYTEVLNEDISSNDQKRIVNELLDTLKQEVLKKLPRIPENWDGIELRWWIEDVFIRTLSNRPKNGKRYKDYENDYIVNNL